MTSSNPPPGNPEQPRFRFSNLKLANQITLIAGFLSLTIMAGLVLFAGQFSNSTMTNAAEVNFKEQIDGLRRSADLVYEVSASQVDKLAHDFEVSYKSEFSVDDNQTVSLRGVEIPLAKLDGKPLHQDDKAIDLFTEETGALGTIFVRSGDNFIRVATTVQDEKGDRVLGTALDKDSAIYRKLLNGETYIGQAKLFGKHFMAKYIPVTGKDGHVVGALFVGMDLTGTLRQLFDMFRQTKFGEQGYAYVVDASQDNDRGRFLAHPTLTGTLLQDVVDGTGRTGTLTPMLDQKSGLFTYTWFNDNKESEDKFVAFDHSDLWDWIIVGGILRSEITSAGLKMQETLGLFGLVSSIALAGLLWLAISRRMKPLGQLRGVVHRLTEGDDEARANLDTLDEVGELGTAFDRMMDERVATQNAIRRENEQLNESVLGLLQAVAQLSRKDLTVKVPVTEDVTGAVADALNLLTSETGKVLLEVSDISADVTAASLKVKEQANTVMAVAEQERAEVEHTADALAVASSSMTQIADLARVCNEAADNAIKTTQRALQTVTNTVGGINSTRDIIRETEKRIKRLGERSQEISGVVNLINTIAERTHILALNASMHAASAGEAGRGFAVVADEVQRLAESARQATAQIATLVNSIQVETADTVNTMNAAIAQVVEGSKLAEQAGEQMQNTQTTTSELVGLVQKIAASSQEQAEISQQLLERASEIRKSSEQTTQRLAEQGEYTDNLVDYARSLLSTVRVFKLPA